MSALKPAPLRPGYDIICIDEAGDRRVIDAAIERFRARLLERLRKARLEHETADITDLISLIEELK